MKNTRIDRQEAPKGVYETMLNTEKYIRSCGLSHSLIHLIKIRASQINGCGYCMDMHYKDALADGDNLERLYLLQAWEESPCYSAAEKAVMALTDVLTSINQAKPEEVETAFHHMTSFYSKEEIANIILTICQINSWNRIAISFGNVPGSYKR